MYADDTHLIYVDSGDMQSIQDSLNSDLRNVSMLLGANKLSLNMTKTEFMLIASTQKLQSLSSDPPVLKINGLRISQDHSSRSLGVIIDEHLSWNAYIDNLAKKVGSALGAIKRIRNCIPHKTLLSIYISLISSDAIRLF